MITSYFEFTFLEQTRNIETFPVIIVQILDKTDLLLLSKIDDMRNYSCDLFLYRLTI